MPPKKKNAKIDNNTTNSQAILKFNNNCIKMMTENLPMQTFSTILPITFKVEEHYSSIPLMNAKIPVYWDESLRPVCQPPQEQPHKNTFQTPVNSQHNEEIDIEVSKVLKTEVIQTNTVRNFDITSDSHIENLEEHNQPTKQTKNKISKGKSRKNKTEPSINTNHSQTSNFNLNLSVEPTLVPTPILKTNNPVILTELLYNQIPFHPNIKIKCAFCSTIMPFVQHCTENPQARRRFMPVCSSCYLIL
jgi:hypothetical protein